MIIQLFALVNEKNELFRRQTELIYMKKENRLEEMHADCEYKIRVLMSKPECQRTDDDKMSEERLISKLVEIVSQRNEIVDCLEMDRLRELDEDTAIEDHMSNYAAVKPVVLPKNHGSPWRPKDPLGAPYGPPRRPTDPRGAPLTTAAPH